MSIDHAFSVLATLAIGWLAACRCELREPNFPGQLEHCAPTSGHVLLSATGISCTLRTKAQHSVSPSSVTIRGANKIFLAYFNKFSIFNETNTLYPIGISIYV